jgi:hypothetical protein
VASTRAGWVRSPGSANAPHPKPLTSESGPQTSRLMLKWTSAARRQLQRGRATRRPTRPVGDHEQCGVNVDAVGRSGGGRRPDAARSQARHGRGDRTKLDHVSSIDPVHGPIVEELKPTAIEETPSPTTPPAAPAEALQAGHEVCSGSRGISHGLPGHDGGVVIVEGQPPSLRALLGDYGFPGCHRCPPAPRCGEGG